MKKPVDVFHFIQTAPAAGRRRVRDAERSLPDLWLTSADQPCAATSLKLNIQEGSEYEQARRYQDYQHEGAL